MTSRLPKKISPNPLISSTIEIRFSSALSSDDTLSAIRPKFEKEFPKLTTRDLPLERDNIPELEYVAKYILSNDDYQIFIDKNVIAFENIGEYKHWENYYPMIKKNLHLLSDTISINEIKRVGLRYISSFNVVEKLSDSFKFGFDAPLPDYNLENELFRTQLSKKDIYILLHLVKNADINQNGLTEQRTLIDIDISQFSCLLTLIGNELFNLINALHLEEKSFFFSLLKEEFLNKFDCEY